MVLPTSQLAFTKLTKQRGHLQLCICERAPFQFNFLLLPVNQSFFITQRGWLAAGLSQLSVVPAPHAALLDSWLQQVLAPSMDPDAQRFNTPVPCDSGRFCSSLGPDCCCWLQLAWQCHGGAIFRINNPLVKGHQQVFCTHSFATLC